jgi:lactobin A/cerein 7B family class IIb bacteriocin
MTNATNNTMDDDGGLDFAELENVSGGILPFLAGVAGAFIVDCIIDAAFDWTPKAY